MAIAGPVPLDGITDLNVNRARIKDGPALSDRYINCRCVNLV